MGLGEGADGISGSLQIEQIVEGRSQSLGCEDIALAFHRVTHTDIHGENDQPLVPGEMLQEIIGLLGSGTGEGRVEEREAFQRAGRDPGRAAVADEQGVMGKSFYIDGLAFAFRRDIDAQVIESETVERVNDEVEQRQPAGQTAGEAQDQQHIMTGGAIHFKNCNKGIRRRERRKGWRGPAIAPPDMPN